MFTGIVESLGRVVSLEKEDTNLHLTIQAAFTNELQIDQSVAHNGVCLTVVKINTDEQSYVVTAIDETLKKSNIGNLKVGDMVNLERCLRIGDRLDGHMVQGHVDTTAECVEIASVAGSTILGFQLKSSHQGLIVSKGSITINGVSLTVVDVRDDDFSVAIIPYTWEHTQFKFLEKGNFVNLEFDILGKYILAQTAYRFDSY